MRPSLAICSLLAVALAVLTGSTPVDNSPGLNYIPQDMMVDSMALHKSAHELVIFSNGRMVHSYRIHLGLCPTGPKQCEGDYKTPEGLYFINAKNPSSAYHKSLSISYPSFEDVMKARKIGRSPGGDIMIHGLPNGQENAGPRRYQNDWTLGCIAMTNTEIDGLFNHVPTGTPILITP